MRLILSRKVDEEVVIGPPDAPIGIIRVGKFQRGQVRLHFDFPKSVPVNRREVAEEILGRPVEPFGNIGRTQ